MKPFLLEARWIVAAPDRVLEGGALLVRGSVVERVIKGRAAVSRARRSSGLSRLDLGDAVLTPGLVNAHAHLDLSDLHGRVDGSDGFVPWIKQITGFRRTGDNRHRIQAGITLGLERSLGTGTTAVGDISGGGTPPGRGARLRVRLFREVLDGGDPGRSAGILDSVASRLPPRALRCEGISPHAPYTTSSALLLGVSRLLRRRPMPVAIHWAETDEEVRWLDEGRGPLAPLLGASPRRCGLSILEEAGLLGPRLALIHGNLPARGDISKVAAAGASLVHCPGSHAFFDREPFPWKRYQRAGVPIALGTDSLASNEDLDMGREMSLARTSAPWLSPREVWAMATVNGARSIGLQNRAGVLIPGALADLVAWQLSARTAEEALEGMTRGEGICSRTWVGGISRVFAHSGWPSS